MNSDLRLDLRLGLGLLLPRQQADGHELGQLLLWLWLVPVSLAVLLQVVLAVET